MKEQKVQYLDHKRIIMKVISLFILLHIKLRKMENILEFILNLILLIILILKLELTYQDINTVLSRILLSMNMIYLTLVFL